MEDLKENCVNGRSLVVKERCISWSLVEDKEEKDYFDSIRAKRKTFEKIKNERIN